MGEWSAPRDKSVEIWTSLAEMYGSKFIANSGDVPPQMWKAAINGFKDFELQRGLRKLLFKGGATPPTLPQFVAACKYADEDTPPEVQRPALPRPEYADPVYAHAQRCLLAYCWTNKVTAVQLEECIREKNRLVVDFQQMMQEDPSLTGADIKTAMFAAWDRVTYKMADR